MQTTNRAKWENMGKRDKTIIVNVWQVYKISPIKVTIYI